MMLRMSLSSLLLAAFVGLVGGCSWTGTSVFSDKVDYQAARTRTAPLEIPPDLSQLPREERFTVPERPQSVTASSAAAASRPATPATRWTTTTASGFARPAVQSHETARAERSSQCEGGSPHWPE